MSSGFSSAGQAVGSFSGAVTTDRMKKALWHQTKREMYREEQRLAQELEDLEREETQLISTQAAQYGASGVTSEGSPTEVMLKTRQDAARAKSRAEYWSFQKRYEMQKMGRLRVKAMNYQSITQTIEGGFETASAVASFWGAAA